MADITERQKAILRAALGINTSSQSRLIAGYAGAMGIPPSTALRILQEDIDDSPTFVLTGRQVLDAQMMPPRDGLVSWLDATDPENLTVDANGNVTVARCKASGAMMVVRGTSPIWNGNFIELNADGWIEKQIGQDEPGNALTILTIFRMNSLDGENDTGIVSRWGSDDPDGSYQIIVTNGSAQSPGRARGLLYRDTYGITTITDSELPSVLDGKWHFVAVSWDGTTGKRFIIQDGVYREESTAPGILQMPDGPLRFGTTYDIGNGGKMDGGIAHGLVWNRQLSVIEIMGMDLRSKLRLPDSVLPLDPPTASLTSGTIVMNGFSFDEDEQFQAVFSGGTPPYSGFTTDDVTVTNATVSQSPQEQPLGFSVTPVADGVVTVRIRAGAITDAAGSSSSISDVYSFTHDSSRPMVAISSSTINSGDVRTSLSAISMTVAFTDLTALSTFDPQNAAHLGLSNCTVSSAVKTGDSYAFTLTPTAEGACSAQVLAGAVTDAAGNENLASSAFVFTVELPLVGDYYLDPVNGNDSNDGTTVGTAWATISRLNTYLAAAVNTLQTKTIVLKSGTYTGVGVLLNNHTVASQYTFEFEENVTVDTSQQVTAIAGITVQNSVSGFLATFNLRAAQFMGNGVGSANGIGTTNNGRLLVNGLDADDNYAVFNGYDDGISIHGTNDLPSDHIINGCEFTNSSKGAGNIVNSASAIFNNCRFIGKTGASLGTFQDLSTATSTLNDCVFENGAAAVGIANRCVFGTPSASVTIATRRNFNNDAIQLTDCFVNTSSDGPGRLNLLRCYGFYGGRIRFDSTHISSFRNCVLKPFTGTKMWDGTFWTDANWDGGTNVIENCILLNASGRIVNYTNTSQRDALNANWIVRNCNLFGSADVQSGLTISSNNISTNPLIGAANTTIQSDWGYGTGSPCIGAGTSGGNIGFAA